MNERAAVVAAVSAANSVEPGVSPAV
jgi:hypothetical protein